MDAEVIVVGGGIVGLCTLYNLTKQGTKAILFEQYPYPHTRGSSHGQTRIIRYEYQQEEYARMMPECFEMWNEFQDSCGDEILLKSGLVAAYNMFKNEDVVAFYNSLDQMDRYAPSVEVIPGEKVETRFPGFKLDSKYKAIYDENGGFLKADKCLELLQKLSLQNGGKIQDGEKVISLEQLNDHKVEVTTSKQTYNSNSVILTCGAFTNTLLGKSGLHLPLTVMKPYVFYWSDKSSSNIYSHDKFPAISLRNICYSIPSYEYPGLMKLSCHAVLSVDPEERDKLSNEAIGIENKRILEFKEQIVNHFPEIDISGPAIIESCIYAKTPDYGFIIDRHPRYKNIVIGAGFSGHGFKTAPVVAKLLTELSQGLQPSYPIEAFSIKRFSDSKL